MLSCAKGWPSDNNVVLLSRSEQQMLLLPASCRVLFADAHVLASISYLILELPFAVSGNVT